MNATMIGAVIALWLILISIVTTAGSIVYHIAKRRDNRMERARRYLEELNTAPWEVET